MLIILIGKNRVCWLVELLSLDSRVCADALSDPFGDRTAPIANESQLDEDCLGGKLLWEYQWTDSEDEPSHDESVLRL